MTNLKHQLLLVNEALNENKQHLLEHSKDLTALVRHELTSMIQAQDYTISSTKEDLVLSHKKLAKERSDMQVLFGELKSSVIDVINGFEQQAEDIKYLKNWS